MFNQSEDMRFVSNPWGHTYLIKLDLNKFEMAQYVLVSVSV